MIKISLLFHHDDQDADDQITPMDAAAPIRLTARLLRRASVAKRAMSWK